MHDSGVRLIGASASPAPSTIEGTRKVRALWLHGCRFAEAPVLRNASLAHLLLAGSFVRWA
ncbi:MAG: hypothetical protein R3D33_03080 [Hyphomicrobiaceae bacterium]